MFLELKLKLNWTETDT